MSARKSILSIALAIVGTLLILWLPFIVIGLIFGDTVSGSLQTGTYWFLGGVAVIAFGSLFSIVAISAYASLSKVIDRALHTCSEPVQFRLVHISVGALCICAFAFIIWSNDISYRQLELIALETAGLYFLFGVFMFTFTIVRNLTAESKMSFTSGWAFRTYLVGLTVVTLIAFLSSFAPDGAEVEISRELPLSRITEYSLKSFLLLIGPVVAGCHAGLKVKGLSNK